ncbi:MAG: hypothetical protein WD059_10645 [Balneolaceae bacterium]
MALKSYKSIKTKPRSKLEIRTFTKQDVDQVVKMSMIHFPENSAIELNQLKDNFHSNLSDSYQSLVCSSSDGVIHGYLSVQMVEFNFKGSVVTGAILSDFMVNEKARSALVPMRMLQKALNGPQDFSFSEDAVQASRLLWCKLGGQIAFPYSTYYTIPLRLLSFSIQMAGKNLSPRLKKIAGTAAKKADKIMETFKVSPFYVPPRKELSVRKLNSQQLHEGLRSIITNHDLFPSVNSASLGSFLNLIRNERQYGKPEGVALCDSEGKTIGWFIYYQSDSGRCNVIHAESLPGKEEELYISLKINALSKGAVNITGRLSPRQVGSSFSEQTISRPGGKWALVHSKNPEILHTIQTGKAFLTRCW